MEENSPLPKLTLDWEDLFAKNNRKDISIMSHAAHRYGTKEEFKDDYNILVKPYKGIDDENETTREEAIEKAKKLADIAFEHGAVNLGRRSGCTGRGDDYNDYSFGIWGKTELLPDDAHLKITTRCGHHMISPAMIDHYVEKIKEGSITPEEAGKKLAAPCVCGIFNVPKTIKEIKKMAIQ